MTTDRLVGHIGWEPTRVNALSSGIPSRIRVPAHFAGDRECLHWVGATAGKVDPAEVTYGWIRNTLELSRLAISPNLRARIDGQLRVKVKGMAQPIQIYEVGAMFASEPKLLAASN